MDVSDIFKFFCLGRGKGESEAKGGWGVDFLLKIPGGGSPGGRGAKGPGGCLGELGNWGGGGLNVFFFRGRNVHQEYNLNGHLMQHLYGANVVALLSGEVEAVL